MATTVADEKEKKKILLRYRGLSFQMYKTLEDDKFLLRYILSRWNIPASVYSGKIKKEK